MNSRKIKITWTALVTNPLMALKLNSIVVTEGR